jgi:DNA-binding NarL/FixJ family response regulator
MAKIDARIRRSRHTDRCSPGSVAVIAPVGPREAIAEVLAQGSFSCDVFDELEALLGLAPAFQPGLIVLWVDDPASGLVDRIEQLTQDRAEALITIVCPTIDRRGVRTALTAGAAGIVLLETLTSALCPSLQSVQAGQISVPYQHRSQVEPPVLSTREKQILGLVVMGYMNGQIAEQLFLAESTVKSHLSSAFGKLGVRSRNEATTLILDPERGLGTGILALTGPPARSEKRLKP